MRKHLDAALRALKASGLWVAHFVMAYVRWVSPAPRLVATITGLVFAISLLSWAIADRRTSYVLYFPSVGSGAVRAEKRDLPRRATAERRAELLAAEFLLGPRSPGLAPAFPAGSTLSGLLLRQGTLFVDIGESAALAPRDELERALAALRRTLSLGIHQSRRVVVTIGGYEAWSEPPSFADADGEKSSEKN